MTKNFYGEDLERSVDEASDFSAHDHHDEGCDCEKLLCQNCQKEPVMYWWKNGVRQEAMKYCEECDKFKCETCLTPITEKEFEEHGICESCGKKLFK